MTASPLSPAAASFVIAECRPWWNGRTYSLVPARSSAFRNVVAYRLWSRLEPLVVAAHALVVTLAAARPR